MQKFLAVLSLSLVLGFLIGCGGDDPIEPGGVNPPTGLTIAVAAPDSLSIQLSWTASTTILAQVDGYIVYFTGAPIDTTTALSYTHTNPTSLGDYYVTAYKGSEESSAPDTVSTNIVVATNQGPIYELDSSNPSGYGWKNDGSGKVFSAVSANMDSIDIIIDADHDLRSPSDTLIGGWHTTPIADAGLMAEIIYDTLSVAPITGYANFQTPNQGNAFFLWIQDAYYAKMYVLTAGGSHPDINITFKYGFQPVSGFRRLN